jgi:hypothetical protein
VVFRTAVNSYVSHSPGIRIRLATDGSLRSSARKGLAEEVKTQVPETTNGRDDQGVNGFPPRNRILVLVPPIDSDRGDAEVKMEGGRYVNRDILNHEK